MTVWDEAKVKEERAEESSGEGASVRLRLPIGS